MNDPGSNTVEDYEVSAVYDYGDQTIIYTTDDEQIVIMDDE